MAFKFLDRCYNDAMYFRALKNTFTSGKLLNMVEKSPNHRWLLKIIIAVLLISLIGSSFLIYDNLEKIKLKDRTISSLSDSLESKKEEIKQLETHITGLKQNLSLMEALLKNETNARQKLEKELLNLTTVAKSQYSVLAVDENGKGHLIPLEVIIKSGRHNLFLNVANVRFDETLQSSAQTAVYVARDFTRTSLVDKDVLINIESPEVAQGVIISGGSAGAAITLSVIAAMQGRTIKKDVLITGTIRTDHSIGRISAARAKALAAKQNGAVLFLVPRGQKGDVGDVGIEVREVATIEDAVKYAIAS